MSRISMALGPFMFRAHGFGYSGLGRTLDTGWAAVETAGGLDALQWTGPRSETLTITGVLFPQEFGGIGTLEGLRLAASSGVAMNLVSLGGAVLGRHAVQKISEDRMYMNRQGVPGRVSYSLELKRLSGMLPRLAARVVR